MFSSGVAALRGQSLDILASALTPASKRAYDAAWNKFATFADFHGLPCSLPLPSDHILWFLTDLFNRGLSYASFPPLLSALSYHHKMGGAVDSTKSFQLQQFLVSVKRKRSSRDSRQPLTHNILATLLLQLERSALPVYDRRLFAAMFLLAFHFGLRLGEITRSPHNLMLDAVHLSGESLCLTFNSYKHASGPPITHRVGRSSSSLCPVSALGAFLRARGIRPGPLFLLSGEAVSRNHFNKQLKLLLHRAGIQARITSHSFRIGAATWWAGLNYSEACIRRLGRWKSNAFLKYIRGPVAHPAIGPSRDI